ncbi:hypothetical protein BJX61DRAFT_255732 [Aspergillus egyptiacus]|nr:hypothetical protein BJX61DRAFT_255732 [Aspergillus egyptiacus]
MSPKAFITGATGFIGRVVTEFAVKEGYTVRGLSRREEGDTLLRSLGATPVRGDLNNAALLAEESKDADIVFHLAYDHDFSKPYQQLVDLDISAVSALANGLEGSNKALIVTNGTVGIQADPNGGETDESSPREEHPFLNRYVAENHALSFTEKGIRVVSIRLPQYVYGRGTTTGFAAQLIKLAIKSGESVYIGDGEYCFSDVYVDDAARLYLAAAKHAKAGDVFNGTGHTTTSYKALATAIGDAVQVPVRSISKEDAAARWGQFLAGFISITDRSSNRKAVEQFGWKPEGPGLLWEICSGSYVAVAKQFKADVVAS